MRQTVTRWCKRLIEAAIGPIQTDITQLETDVSTLNIATSALNAKASQGAATGFTALVAPAGLQEFASSPQAIQDSPPRRSRVSFWLAPLTISTTASLDFYLARNGAIIGAQSIDPLTVLGRGALIGWDFWRLPADSTVVNPALVNDIYSVPFQTSATGVVTYGNWNNTPVEAPGTPRSYTLSWQTFSNNPAERFSITGISWEYQYAVTWGGIGP